MAETNTVVTAMSNVFSAVFNWLKTAITGALDIFYVDGEFTFLGITLLISLGISIFFLLISVISNFVHLRG